MLVPAGFQAGASAATGNGGQVIFETGRGGGHAGHRGGHRGDGSGSCLPGGPGAGRVRRVRAAPIPGNALWVGLAVQPGVASPAPSLSLAMVAADTAGTPPPPVMAGGVAASGGRTGPAGELGRGGRPAWSPPRLVRDETGGLSSGGIIELDVPAQWRPGRPPGSVGLPELLWLRALLEYGEYPSPPVFSAILVNAARAPATQTIFNEPLVLLPDGPDGLTRMQLSQTPIVPGSIELDVDVDPGGDVFGTAPGRPRSGARSAASAVTGRRHRYSPSTTPVAWSRSATGCTARGCPPGSGTCARRSTGRRRGGRRCRAGAVNAPLTSVGFVTAVSNPYPASGGTDTETDSRAILRGAQELRAGEGR